jgi:hypothetical protein
VTDFINLKINLIQSFICVWILCTPFINMKKEEEPCEPKRSFNFEQNKTVLFLYWICSIDQIERPFVPFPGNEQRSISIIKQAKQKRERAKRRPRADETNQSALRGRHKLPHRCKRIGPQATRLTHTAQIRRTTTRTSPAESKEARLAGRSGT